MAKARASSGAGRTRQKQRTREALVTHVRLLMGNGSMPSVTEVADAAGISRTTAYRYFPSQEALVAAALPRIDADTLIPVDAPADVSRRLDLVLDQQFRILRDWEPQLRAALAASLAPQASQPALRTGRALGWFEEALSPLRGTHPRLDVRRLAIRLRCTCGIESFVWLTDVAALPREEACDAMRANAHAVLSAALASEEA